MTSKCKTCGHDKSLHVHYKNEKPYCVGCRLEEAIIKCEKFQPEDVCPNCKEPLNSKLGCKECCIFNWKKQKKGCGKDTKFYYFPDSGKVPDWKLEKVFWKCGENGIFHPECENQSPRSAEDKDTPEESNASNHSSFGNQSPHGVVRKDGPCCEALPEDNSKGLTITSGNQSSQFLNKSEGTFNLSEKIFLEKEWIGGGGGIATKDVKEFLRRLKEIEIEVSDIIGFQSKSVLRALSKLVNDEIDKLAGERLIKLEGGKK